MVLELWATREARKGFGSRAETVLDVLWTEPGTGGSSVEDVALIWATRFLTEDFLAFKPGIFGGKAVS